MDILNISGFTEESVVDGPGMRAVVFTQGCPHHCKGCHNPQTHPFSGGKQVQIQELAQRILNNPLLSGVTFSGGEPMCQPAPLFELAKLLTANNLNIVIYTGYTFEELIEENNKDRLALLSQCKILIDGRFVLEQRDLMLKFRGSRNQRILDCQASLKAGAAVLMDNI